MTLALIVAVAENNVIGCDNRLIWHLSEDLKRFKTITMGHPIIMGRKTFESIGRALPGRLNIVITTQTEFNANGCTIVHSLHDALNIVAHDKETAFVIGGESVYRQALPYCSHIYLTRIHKSYEGDSFFPELSANTWREQKREDFASGLNFEYPYSFITYVRE